MTGILNILAGSIASAIKDGYFNLTTLLLSGDGTNGAQNNTFLDSSANNFTITRNGNTTQGTFSPFSQTGWSNYFNGSSGFRFADSADFSMGTNAFTIECFVYLTKTQSAGSGFISQWIDANDSNSSWQLGVDWNGGAGGNKFAGQISIGGTVTTINDTTNYALNTWHHVVLCRSGSPGTTALFVNGVRVASSTVTGSIVDATNPVGIGVRGGSDSYYQDGVYISNARIVNGTDVYGATNTTLTVPTAPLTAVTNTKLLTCQSNRFLDTNTQVTAKAVSQVLGTPSVQAFSPFAPTAAYSTSTVGGSGYFDGSGDTLTWTDASNVLDIGGSQASAEWWFYPQSTSATQVIMYKGGGATNWNMTNGFEWHIQFVSQKFTFAYSDGGGGVASIADTTTRGINQWYHVVVATNSSNAISLFVNGVRVATATGAIGKPSSRTSMGLGSDLSGNFYLGYSSAVRVIKGAGAYDPTQTTITVPTAPPTAITNTQLLLNFTNGGIIDATGKNVLETVGNAQISTTQSKFGGSSMYFDGTGDRLYIPDGKGYVNGTEPFTLECWVYLGGTPNYWTIFGSSSGSGLLFTVQNLTTVIVNPSGAGNTLSGTTSLTAGTWFHLALTRNSSNRFDIWVNGVSVGNATSSQSFGTPTHFVIGAADNSGGQQFNGYLDDVRISKFCRYTTTFTPPTAAFPLS